MLLGRRAFASQRVPVCLPATLVDSSSFCFATCVCLSACGFGRLVELLLRNVCLSVCHNSLHKLCLRPKIDSRRLQNRPSEPAKSTLGGSQIDPRSPWGGPGAPESAQEPPKSAPRAPKSAPRAPKSAPRAAQERPGGSQDASQGAPGAWGDHFDAYKFEERAFRERAVARLAR